ncbi:Rv2175c family DNA-binding protein [Brachybacterium muris]|uniref:Rv2175c family DNA-binding protein n=1 Tax=Brachybacterium muris TaxID=219301 RepID=UPI003B967B12
MTPVIDRARPGGRGTLVGVNELDDLIPSWLTLPDVARVLDVEVSRVRRLIDEGELVAVRRGDPVVRSVPADLLLDGDIAPHLGGTITVLRDGGFEDEELLRWLFTEDETLPGRPIDHLRRGQRGEVRRRAQALAF